ncbi:MAG: methylmalonyl Co-A mutase-associated GTPase MeaB [bacterium]|nr:methylmalonyl Co-A mutase-associated GTPase MeaB [bacterium]MCP5066113.1 methylmalonyl Co-A mutase-associated GTPase MeaB [bacterium]
MGRDLAARLLARDRAAVAPALNLVDDHRPEARREATAVLAALEEKVLFGGARRIGLTGAPGAGKSTLLDALVRRLRSHDQTLGVVAVDPSSQRTGGALLGDRMRVRSGAADPGVFIRSMAARERLGGLAEAARASVTILAAAFDVVLVETVGVGQSEGEVADLVDTLVYVAQPGAGDLVQFMKAGILELPDVVVVNKADLGLLAERTANELKAGFGLGERNGAWEPPVVLVSARDGTGLDELETALQGHLESLTAEGLQTRRRRGRDASVRKSLERRYGSHGLTVWGGQAKLAARLADERDPSGFALTETLGREIEAALRTTETSP